MRPNTGTGTTNQDDKFRKIIKNQEMIIQDLERQLQKQKGGFDSAYYEHELAVKNKEIQALHNKVSEIQASYNKEKTLLAQFIEKYQGGLDGLKVTLDNERLKHEKKVVALEESHRAKIGALESENKMLISEIEQLRNAGSSENLANQAVENVRVLDDLRKMNEFFLQKEGEYRAVVQHLKSKSLNRLLDIYLRL